MGDQKIQQQVDDAVRRIAREIEYEMFYGLATPEEKLFALLYKLGLKSITPKYEGSFGIASSLRK